MTLVGVPKQEGVRDHRLQEATAFLNKNRGYPSKALLAIHSSRSSYILTFHNPLYAMKMRIISLVSKSIFRSSVYSAFLYPYKIKFSTLLLGATGYQTRLRQSV